MNLTKTSTKLGLRIIPLIKNSQTQYYSSNSYFFEKSQSILMLILHQDLWGNDFVQTTIQMFKNNHWITILPHLSIV